MTTEEKKEIKSIVTRIIKRSELAKRALIFLDPYELLDELRDELVKALTEEQ